MAIIGYARVSTTDQNLDLQLHPLQEAGAQRTFSDQGVSGSLDSPTFHLVCSNFEISDERRGSTSIGRPHDPQKVLFSVEEVGLYLGEPVDPVLVSMAESAIRECVAESPTDPRKIFDHLEVINSTVAASSQGRVGTAIQLLAMTKSGFESGSMSWATLAPNGAIRAGVMCDYRGRDVQSTDPAMLQFPAMISSQISMVGGFFSMDPESVKVPTDRYPKVG